MTWGTITKTTLSFEIPFIAKFKTDLFIYLFILSDEDNCYPIYFLSSSLKSFGLDFVS